MRLRPVPDRAGPIGPGGPQDNDPVCQRRNGPSFIQNNSEPTLMVTSKGASTMAPTVRR